MMSRLVVLIPIVLMSACSTSRETRVVSPATPAERSALIDRVKSLEGTWETVGGEGPRATHVFAVSSAGSVVREIMFPGEAHEMTNMYTMDGSDLMLTHYCAVGNQPHMRAAAGGPADRLEFRPAGVSNWTSTSQVRMNQMTLTFIDADHIRQEWKGFKDGKMEDHAKFELKRRK